MTWGYEGTKIIGEDGIILCFGFGWGDNYFKSRALLWLFKILGLDVNMEFIVQFPKPDIRKPFTPIIIDIPEGTLIKKVIGIPNCPSCNSSRSFFQSTTGKCVCKRCGSIFFRNGRLIKKNEITACPKCWGGYSISYDTSKSLYYCYDCNVRF